jgi:hypothetical protein
MSPLRSGCRTGRLVIGIILSLIVGCGSEARPTPKTVSVSGKITYKDKPLAGASVGFVSALDNKDVLPAQGKTNDAGEFTLTTYVDPEHQVSGATPGEFVVTVSKTKQMDREKVMEEFQKNPAMEFKSEVPEKYSDSKKTPLKAPVTVDGKNRFEFTLEED